MPYRIKKQFLTVKIKSISVQPWNSDKPHSEQLCFVLKECRYETDLLTVQTHVVHYKARNMTKKTPDCGSTDVMYRKRM